MSIFPTKILLATDGSKEAELAFASAADLSRENSLGAARRLCGAHAPRILRVPGRYIP